MMEAICTEIVVFWILVLLLIGINLQFQCGLYSKENNTVSKYP